MKKPIYLTADERELVRLCMLAVIKGIDDSTNLNLFTGVARTWTKSSIATIAEKFDEAPPKV